jgi:hypothetical protein
MHYETKALQTYIQREKQYCHDWVNPIILNFPLKKYRCLEEREKTDPPGFKIMIGAWNLIINNQAFCPKRLD